MSDSNYNKIIGICCVNICLILISQLVLVIIIYVQFSDGSNRYQSLLNNWEQNIITDFYIPQNDQKCQTNDTSIFNYYWPGTSSGCRCYYGEINGNSCCDSFDSNNNEKNCCYGFDLDENPPQTFDHWGAGPIFKDPIRICAKRIQGYNFRMNAPSDFQCKDNEKMCGGKEKENQQNLFCVPKELNCPIQEIYIQQDSKGSLEEYNISNGTNSIKLFINRNSSNKLPLSQFRVSSSTEACWDQTETYIPSKASVLDRRSETCSRSSTFYSDTIFEIDEFKYFLANGINITQKDNFIPSKYQLHLLQNQYVNIKMSCRDKIEPLFENNSQINSIHKFCLVLLILVILNQVFVIGYNLSRTCFKDSTNKNPMRCVYFIKVLFILTCIVTALVIVNKYISQINLLENYTEMSCFEGEEASMIQSIQKKFNRSCIIGLIVMLIYQLLTDTDLLLCIINKTNSDLAVDDQYHPF